MNVNLNVKCCIKNNVINMMNKTNWSVSTSVWHFFVAIILLLACSNYASSTPVSIDVTKTIVWGPGLNPERITLRARYIFLQLVDIHGKNITESPGKRLITPVISAETRQGSQCFITSEILDCLDGSFIIRYRNYHTCFNLKITLKMKNEIVPLKESIFKGPVYAEECNCPHPSIQSWLKNNECSQNYTQMQNDLKIFPSVNFDNLRKKMIAAYDKSKSVSLCHYVVKSNKIYRTCYGQHVGFKIFVDDMLLSLTKKVVLPDLEFFINLGDWPLVPKNKELYPIFSWCGSEDTNDIILPTYEITRASIEAMGGGTLDMLSIQGNTKLPWNKKIEKVFWKGRDSRRERLNLIDIARKHPDMFNASITRFFFFRDEMDKYGPEQKHISFFDFFEYKYQLNIDGSVAAYRFPFLLAGDSLVFKQNSKYYEFFYKDIKAGTHFISIKSDLSDLVDKVDWAKKNDDEVFKITRNSRQYVRDNLMPQHIFCYHVALFEEWSKRLKSEVQVFPEMELVAMPKHDCECVTSEEGIKYEL